jgi:multidrug efflux system outer membrane protein
MQHHSGGRFRASYTLLFSAGAVLVSCGSPQVYEVPEMRLPDRYSMVVPIRSTERSDPNWWRAFNDPVLDRLIAEGLSGSVTLAEAKARLREAEALAQRANSAVVGDGRIEGTRNSDNDNDAGEVGLNAEFQPPGGLTSRVGAARARLEAEGYGQLNVMRVLLSEVAVAYIDLRFAQQQLVFRQEDLASRRKTLDEVTAQVNSGAATEFDLMRAQSLISETQTQIPRIEAEIVAQRNRVSTLLGRPVGDLNVNLAFPGRQPSPIGEPAAGVPADLIRARPDIQRAERLYAAAVSDIGEAKAARYPRLSLSGLITTPLAGGNSA